MIGLKKGLSLITLQMPITIPGEQIPVGLIAIPPLRLIKTGTSYTLRKGSRAVCNLHKKRSVCDFILLKPKKP